MRTILVNFIAACSGLATLIAGRLDVAVIQFPEEKAPTELESALAKVNLFEMTNADRTRTTHPYLKGGYVLFAQRFPASLGSSFSTVTRLKNASADVEGHLGAGSSLGVHFAHGRCEGGIANLSEKGLHGFRPVAPGITARAGCPPDQGPVSKRRQRPDQDGELFSNHCRRCAIRSLGGVEPKVAWQAFNSEGLTTCFADFAATMDLPPGTDSVCDVGLLLAGTGCLKNCGVQRPSGGRVFMRCEIAAGHNARSKRFSSKHGKVSTA